MTAAKGTVDAHQLTPAMDWEIVHVWENFIGQTCEADKTEKFGVNVHGVEQPQWLENFKWGSEVMSRLAQLEIERLKQQLAALGEPAIGEPTKGNSDGR